MSYDPLPELRPLVRAKAAAPTRATRRSSGRARPRRRSAAAARRERVYTKALQLIGERCAEADLTIDDVARAIPISARTLQQIFTEHGERFSETLRATRIEQAAELVLVAPGRAEVGRRVGYRHENHFARAFERRLGVSPSVLGRAVHARDRYERMRAEPPPESTRSLGALKMRMREDAALVGHVRRQLASAA